MVLFSLAFLLGLAAGDQVAIFTTSSAQVIPFTAEVAALVSAIEGLRVTASTQTVLIERKP